MELVKCRLQMQQPSCAAPTTLLSELRGSRDTVREILAADGWKGLYRGNVACASREVASYVGMFGTYEILKGTFGQTEGAETSAVQTVAFGGLAGVACWSVSYPQDVIKSHLQVRPEGTFKPRAIGGVPWLRDGGMLEAGRSVVKAHGWAGLWRGYSACALRAFPANGAGFLAYEATMSMLCGR